MSTTIPTIKKTPHDTPGGPASADGLVEAGLICQSCAGDAPRGKCKNPKCIGGPIVRELVPAAGVAIPLEEQKHGD